MLNIKNIYIQTFLAIKADTKLLDLLEIKYKDVDENTFLTNLRKQVIEGSNPDDLLNDYSTRLCVHERDGGYTTAYEDVGYINVDVHIAKDKNKLDNRLSDIVKRIVEVIDTKQRQSEGLKPLNVGLYGLIYKTRSLDNSTSNSGWEKYTITFEYKYIL